jgi:methionyl-tRNA formyltransferase
MNKETSKILLICQGSQAVQLIREFFSLRYVPSQIHVITFDFKNDIPLISFLNEYEIKKYHASKQTFNKVLFDCLKLDFELVISFSNPFIISEKALSSSIFLNFHPGWLPKYRGSLSTVYSLINNEKYVGGSWHFIEKGVDKGSIIKRFKIYIDKNDTAFSLNHRIFGKGINYLRFVLEKVNQNYKGIIQANKKGFFYLNKFPPLENISDKELLYKLTFFPPKFK